MTLFADVGIPMLAVVWPVAWLAFLPVVVVEAFVALKTLKIGFRRALLVTAAANAVSTLVGIPITWFITWFVLGIAQVTVGPPSLWHADDTLMQAVMAVCPRAAWLGPYGDASRMVPIAAIVLCVPFYFASVWIEYLVVRRMVPNDSRQVRRFSWWANSWSYTGIVVFWVSCLLSSEYSTGASMPRLTSGEAAVITEIEKLGGRVDAYEDSRDRSGIRINLFDSRMTDADLRHLRGLAHRLQWLYLNSNITDAGMEHIKGLTNLRELWLGESKVTDAGLVDMEGLTQLRDLSLSKTQVTDAGLDHVKGLTNLRSLSLSETNVTDAGLVRLKGLPNLQWLGLSSTKVTAEGVRDLQQALPNCKIER